MRPHTRHARQFAPTEHPNRADVPLRASLSLRGSYSFSERVSRLSANLSGQS